MDIETTLNSTGYFFPVNLSLNGAKYSLSQVPNQGKVITSGDWDVMVEIFPHHEIHLISEENSELVESLVFDSPAQIDQRRKGKFSLTVKLSSGKRLQFPLEGRNTPHQKRTKKYEGIRKYSESVTNFHELA